jgi:hypothetical protein
MMLRNGEITVSPRTPFQRSPELKTKYYLALLGGPETLPFGLDVWHRQRKLLEIEWGENGRIAVVSFTSGDWELERSWLEVGRRTQSYPVEP